MVAYLDKLFGRLMHALDEMGVTENTVVVFLADNGTDQLLGHRRGETGQIAKGGKGSMTDRGTRVPLCEIAGAPLPKQSIHGRSFAPQLLGQPGNPRRWVHVQDKTGRYVRSNTHILTDAGVFRPVVALPDAPGEPIDHPLTDDERAQRALLHSAFDELAR